MHVYNIIMQVLVTLDIPFWLERMALSTKAEDGALLELIPMDLTAKDTVNTFDV